MSEVEIRKIISAVERWPFSKKHKREIIVNLVQDEAGIGSEKAQEKYILAVQKNDSETLKKLKIQQEKRKQKALKWLEENGY